MLLAAADLDIHQVMVLQVDLVVVEMAELILDREQQELPTKVVAVVEVPTLQQELLVAQVSSSSLTQQHHKLWYNT